MFMDVYGRSINNYQPWTLFIVIIHINNHMIWFMCFSIIHVWCFTYPCGPFGEKSDMARWGISERNGACEWENHLFSIAMFEYSKAFLFCKRESEKTMKVGDTSLNQLLKLEKSWHRGRVFWRVGAVGMSMFPKKRSALESTMLWHWIADVWLCPVLTVGLTPLCQYVFFFSKHNLTGAY